MPVERRGGDAVLWGVLQYFHQVRIHSISYTRLKKNKEKNKPKTHSSAEMLTEFVSEIIANPAMICLFPGTLTSPPPWSIRAPAARRCAPPVARWSCSAWTETSSPSPTPTWRSADVGWQSALPPRPLAEGEASSWFNKNHQWSRRWCTWHAIHFFFSHIVLTALNCSWGHSITSNKMMQVSARLFSCF